MEKSLIYRKILANMLITCALFVVNVAYSADDSKVRIDLNSRCHLTVNNENSIDSYMDCVNMAYKDNRNVAIKICYEKAAEKYASYSDIEKQHYADIEKVKCDELKKVFEQADAYIPSVCPGNQKEMALYKLILASYLLDIYQNNKAVNLDPISQSFSYIYGVALFNLVSDVASYKQYIQQIMQSIGESSEGIKVLDNLDYLVKSYCDKKANSNVQNFSFSDISAASWRLG